ncbi:MAG: GDP-mannose 4,6-dehydratase [Nanoarchaeota archaeon]|nr:GDP-mannose 4,6-dehydratase [Nanoarchaeota archaeon]
MEKRIFKTALITGITGSGGSYLADYIIQSHPEVFLHGISRWHSTGTDRNLENAKEKAKVHECDLLDLGATIRVLKEVKPDVIFHLAAHANVKASFTNPLSVIQNNVMSAANLLEAVRLAEIDPVIQICSTSEVYGQVDPKNVPIKEDCPINPGNPYAVSKTVGDFLGFVYFRSYGMKVVRTRMFAYLNPRREDLFATAWAKQVARIEAGLQKELLHGNLDSTRTLIDVRDAMESYWIAAEKCRFGEAYNIGGPTVIKIGDFLDILKKKAKTEIPSRVDPTLLRPADVTLQIPDVGKFTEETGWKPRYSFEESVEYLLEYWRKKVKQERA